MRHDPHGHPPQGQAPRHVWLAGKESGKAFLDDRTALALALLDVFEMTADPAWLTDAVTLIEDRVDKRFADRTSGGYFLTADDAEALLIAANRATTAPPRAATPSLPSRGSASLS